MGKLASAWFELLSEEMLKIQKTSGAASGDTKPELESIQRRATHLLSCMTALSTAACRGSSLYLQGFGGTGRRRELRRSLCGMWFVPKKKSICSFEIRVGTSQQHTMLLMNKRSS